MEASDLLLVEDLFSNENNKPMANNKGDNLSNPNIAHRKNLRKDKLVAVKIGNPLDNDGVNNK